MQRSGDGRQLTGVGMREFTHATTVRIGPPDTEQGDGDTAAAASA